jgi:hypothetical protein
MTNGSGSVLLILAAILYFVPSVVAGVRGHHNQAAIFVLNLLLAWTAIGWIIALVWTATAVREAKA